MRKIPIRAWQLGLAVALLIVAIDNRQMLSSLLGGLDLSSEVGWLLLVSLVGLQVVLLLALILLLGPGRSLKFAIVAILVASAFFGYFVDDAGVIFSTAMMNNVADTVRERNASEALELATRPLFLHLLLYGILPSLVITRFHIIRTTALRDFGAGVGAVLCGLALVSGAALADHSSLVLFATEHRDLRYYMTPLYPLASSVEFVADAFDEPPQFHELAIHSEKRVTGNGPRIGVLVIGETARADRFSLDGYERRTNPLLGEMRNLQFFEANSCGTSTAYSVPCMFFLRGHENYTPGIARTESNVLDVLEAAGIATVWIDNNSSCKHVCDRVRSINLRRGRDGNFLADGDYDSVVLPAVAEALDRENGDLLIVVHLMGSHGPAYSNRYPAEFGVFRPACASAAPMECADDELSNAYDNTIVYTDYILRQLIDLLRERADDNETFLLYASDHGESLGENGIYLHGLPISMAPAAQTHVPVILWRSSGHGNRLPRQAQRMAVGRGPMVSHDVIPQTLLGLFGVRSDVYRPALDLTAGDGLAAGTVTAD